MSNPKRRQLLRLPAAASALLAGLPARGAGNDLPGRLDLVVRAGRVIDPGSGFDGQADIGVLNGLIHTVSPDLSAVPAAQTIDAKGRIVCPGLIDAHVHVADGMMPVSMEPDLAGISSGVTTVLDAGSTGGRTFEGFRKHIIKRAETRVYTLLNISSVGLVVLNELYLDAKFISRKRALRTIRANRDLIIGLKARVRGRAESLEHDISVMKTVREIGIETGLPVMMHWTNEPRLLDTLRPGDYLTHPFNPDYLNPGATMADGTLYPTVLELKDRGLMVDLGHGSSFDWRKAEAAARQNWFPDVLSTDMFTRYYRPDGVVGDLGSVMSKFLLLGLSLPQVIEKTTIAPVRMTGMPGWLGSLAPGAIADITILEMEQGSFTFTDSPRLKQTRTGEKKLRAVTTIKSGRVWPAS